MKLCCIKFSLKSILTANRMDFYIMYVYIVNMLIKVMNTEWERRVKKYNV